MGTEQKNGVVYICLTNFAFACGVFWVYCPLLFPSCW